MERLLYREIKNKRFKDTDQHVGKDQSPRTGDGMDQDLLYSARTNPDSAIRASLRKVVDYMRWDYDCNIFCLSGFLQDCLEIPPRLTKTRTRVYFIEHNNPDGDAANLLSPVSPSHGVVSVIIP